MIYFNSFVGPVEETKSEHGLSIHPKSEQIGGDLLLSTEKLAERVCISGRKTFATKVS